MGRNRSRIVGSMKKKGVKERRGEERRGEERRGEERRGKEGGECTVTIINARGDRINCTLRGKR
jgi:hypothetical protein